MEMPLPLVVKDIHFSYDSKEVLKGIGGSFFEGTFYSIVGPNGSGKTTWLKLIAGINPLQSGSVELFGKSISTLTNKSVAKHLSFVPQMFNIQYAFTVEEVVAMGRYPYMSRFAILSEEDNALVQMALEETNLIPLKDRFVNELSGGELQRVIIARAIAQDTDIIVLDEPISHLDIHYQYGIVTLLKRLCREKKKTVITVLHDLNVTMNHCDHIFLIKDGKVMTQGEPLKVLTEEVVQKVYGLNVKIVETEEEKWITW